MEQTATLGQSDVGRSEIGGYEVIRAMSEGHSWLAAAPGGRVVALKVLDDDCLWKGQLHPSIKDRLGRVRELAHTGVANLYGVERDAGLVYLVWEFVQGQNLIEYASTSQCGGRDFLLAARELVMGVEMLHARGIVHGAIKGENVILAEGGRRVVLTHVSPLLYSEPDGDVVDLLALLGDLLEHRGEIDTPLGRLVEGAREQGLTLRQLAGKMSALIEAREPAEVREEGPARHLGRRIRRRSMTGAIALALGGILLFAGLWHFGMIKMPRPPAPAGAPPAAFQPISRISPAPMRTPQVLPTPMPRLD